MKNKRADNSSFLSATKYEECLENVMKIKSENCKDENKRRFLEKYDILTINGSE